MSTPKPASPPPPKPEGEKEEEVDPEIVLTDVVKDEEAAAAGANEEDDVHTQADSEDSPIPVANKPVDSKRTFMVQLISIAILLIIAIVAVGIMGAVGVFDTKSKSADPVLSESENFQQGDGDVDAPGPAPVDDPGTGQFDGWFDNDWVINEDPSPEEDPPPEEDPWEDPWDETNNFSRSWYFEDGLVGPWRALGGETTVSLDTSGRIEGSNSLLVGGRSAVLHGAGFELIGLFSDETDREEDAIMYSFSGCITLEEEGQCYFVLTTENANGDVERIPYEAMTVYPMSVTEFWGEYYIEESEAPLVSAVVSVECIDPNVDFYLDAMFVSVVLAEEE